MWPPPESSSPIGSDAMSTGIESLSVPSPQAPSERDILAARHGVVACIRRVISGVKGPTIGALASIIFPINQVKQAIRSSQAVGIL